MTMHKSKAQYIANYCNVRMDQTMRPTVDAGMILSALEEYKSLATMVNGFPFAQRYNNQMP